MVRRGRNKRPGDERQDSPAGTQSDPGCEYTHNDINYRGDPEPISPAKTNDSGDKPESPFGESSDSGHENAHDEVSHCGEEERDSPAKVKETGQKSESPAGEPIKNSHEDARNISLDSLDEVGSVSAHIMACRMLTSHEQEERTNKEDNAGFLDWQLQGGTVLPPYPPQGSFLTFPRIVSYPPQDVSRVLNSYEMRHNE